MARSTRRAAGKKFVYEKRTSELSEAVGLAQNKNPYQLIAFLRSKKEIDRVGRNALTRFLESMFDRQRSNYRRDDRSRLNTHLVAHIMRHARGRSKKWDLKRKRSKPIPYDQLQLWAAFAISLYNEMFGFAGPIPRSPEIIGKKGDAKHSLLNRPEPVWIRRHDFETPRERLQWHRASGLMTKKLDELCFPSKKRRTS